MSWCWFTCFILPGMMNPVNLNMFKNEWSWLVIVYICCFFISHQWFVGFVFLFFVGCKMNQKLVDILTQTAIVVFLYTSLVDLFIVNLDVRDKHMYVHCVHTSQWYSGLYIIYMTYIYISYIYIIYIYIIYIYISYIYIIYIYIYHIYIYIYHIYIYIIYIYIIYIINTYTHHTFFNKGLILPPPLNFYIHWRSPIRI